MPTRLFDETCIFVSELLHLSAQSRRFRGVRLGVTEVVLNLAPMDLDLSSVSHDIPPHAAGDRWDRFVGHFVHCSAGALVKATNVPRTAVAHRRLGNTGDGRAPSHLPIMNLLKNDWGYPVVPSGVRALSAGA